jgi:hypothetical protein
MSRAIKWAIEMRKKDKNSRPANNFLTAVSRYGAMATHCGIVIGRAAALRPLKDKLSDILGVQEETSAGSVSWATMAGKSNVPKKIAWTEHAVKRIEKESQEGAKIYNFWKDKTCGKLCMMKTVGG